MAIAVDFNFRGTPIEKYDQSIEIMGFKKGGPKAWPGIFHWAMKTGDGYRVVDVWDSRPAFDAFAKEVLEPVVVQLGIGPPEQQFFDVHNFIKGPPGK
jgi:hypothetical protein